MKNTSSGRVYKQNRPQQLRGFYYVAVTGSFSAAAERMCLGQPAVTLQVQALERELKVRLFQRKSDGVVLTREGRALFEIAAPIVTGLESVEEAFDESLGQLETGEVVCAAPDVIVGDILPELVRSFREIFPQINVTLHSCPSSVALTMLLRSETDFAIGAAAYPSPRSIVFHPLAEYYSYIIVPRGHPLDGCTKVTLADIAQYPFVAPLEEGQLWQPLYRELARLGLAARIIIRVANAEARLRYVESGLGITITTGQRVRSKANQNLVWISLGNQLPIMVYGLMTRKNTHLSLPAKRFAEFVVGSAVAFQALQGDKEATAGMDLLT